MLGEHRQHRMVQFRIIALDPMVSLLIAALEAHRYPDKGNDTRGSRRDAEVDGRI
jgi:hypothetical protein